MYESFRRQLLLWLKVPAAPRPPLGDLASLQVFRAGRNYYALRLASWGAAQVLALAGIIFWAAMLIEVESTARTEMTNRSKQTTAIAPGGTSDASTKPAESSRKPSEKWIDGVAKKIAASGKKNINGWAAFKQLLVEIALVLPPWAFPLVWALKIVSFAAYLVQIPVTYMVRRLDYEMRWYMVTDRSLRLRHGVWKVVESTMSFANIQEVVMTQGPVQRLLGLADVNVKSAGGGGGEKHQKPGEDMHLGIFHCVTNAGEIRDLIIARLRKFRESGLGDPDEKPAVVAAVSLVEVPSDALAAARELAAEARALRAALS